MDMNETASPQADLAGDLPNVNPGDLPAFKQHPDAGYRGRTLENASADLTIAIANDLETAGERLTKKAVLAQGRVYCPIHYRGKRASYAAVQAIRDAIRTIDKQEFTVNIAGNGLYTLNERLGVTQDEVDRYTFELLRDAFKGMTGKKITLLRSGGQTGFDEAGIKAGMSLEIPTEVLAPQGWKLRNVEGVDLSDEVLFKQRFLLHRLKLDYQYNTHDWSTYCYDNDEECGNWDTFGFKRSEVGLLVMEFLNRDQRLELDVNVHAYFSYEMVMLDVQGGSRYGGRFKNIFHIREALCDLEEMAPHVTRDLIMRGAT